MLGVKSRTDKKERLFGDSGKEENGGHEAIPSRHKVGDNDVPQSKQGRRHIRRPISTTPSHVNGGSRKLND
jgi:hypothetical protein